MQNFKCGCHVQQTKKFATSKQKYYIQKKRGKMARLDDLNPLCNSTDIIVATKKIIRDYHKSEIVLDDRVREDVRLYLDKIVRELEPILHEFEIAVDETKFINKIDDIMRKRYNYVKSFSLILRYGYMNSKDLVEQNAAEDMDDEMECFKIERVEENEMFTDEEFKEIIEFFKLPRIQFELEKLSLFEKLIEEIFKMQYEYEIYQIMLADNDDKEKEKKNVIDLKREVLKKINEGVRIMVLGMNVAYPQIFGPYLGKIKDVIEPINKVESKRN
jgi:hypothetical protein